MVVENNVPDLEDMRKAIVEMLFVEGNHMCPTCEKSGNCELQALAYRYRMLVAAVPLPLARSATSTRRAPKIMMDQNRCIQCLRCVRGVPTKDGKNIFGADRPVAATRRSSADRELAAKHVRRARRGRPWTSARWAPS